MSLAFARAVAEGMERHGVKVHWHPGWDVRGNGQRSDYRGMIWHHTATPYGMCPAVLINGRRDLPGPLCNAAGNVDGSVTIVSANPANHAGAGAGRSMGPLPVTNAFNKHVWGLEIVYPGDKPMTAAQYRTACIMAGVVSGILKRPNPEWVRGHAETSRTGKWDPGYAPGKTVDLPRMRSDVWPALHTPTPVQPVTPPRKGLKTMRELHLDNPDGTTPDRVGVMTVDAIGKSLVMPAGAEAWVQFHAFYPRVDMSKVATPECWWLAFCDLAGKQIAAINPFTLPFRRAGAFKLPAGTSCVEVAVRNIPRGGEVGWHVDGRGHA